MHGQQPPGVVQNCSTLQCSKHDIEQCGYDHAPVTRGRMRTQFPWPHGPALGVGWGSAEDPRHVGGGVKPQSSPTATQSPLATPHRDPANVQAGGWGGLGGGIAAAERRQNLKSSSSSQTALCCTIHRRTSSSARNLTSSALPHSPWGEVGAGARKCGKEKAGKPAVPGSFAANPAAAVSTEMGPAVAPPGAKSPAADPAAAVVRARGPTAPPSIVR